MKYIAGEFPAEAAARLQATMGESSIAACITPGYRCQLGEVNGALAGCGSGQCHPYHLFVSERFQRRGVPGRPLEAARAVSLQSGHPRVFTVDASRGAVGF